MPQVSDLSLGLSPASQAILDEHLGDIDVKLTQGNEAIRLSGGGLVMDLDWVGEGYEGDYDEDDPEDEKLLRFSFYSENDENDELTEMDDSSYCTYLSLRMPLVERLHAAGVLFQEVYAATGPNPDGEGRGIKRICESLSAISPRDIELFRIAHHQIQMEEILPKASPTPSGGPRF